MKIWPHQKNFPLSDHFNGQRFYNPTLPKNFSAFSGAWKMLLSKRGPWPRFVENEATPNLPKTLDPSEIALTFINHATFLIQLPGFNILTDPMWSKRASPFQWIGPRRFRDPGLPLADLPEIHLILISHNHYDHLDLATLKKLSKRFTPQTLVSAGNKKLVESTGLKIIHELDWWQEIQINPDFKITFTPTQHFSARGLFDRQHTLWGGYMIHYNNRRLHFGGDAGYSSHFSEIKKRLGPPDIALLGIGAYEPRWFMRPMHMTPAEAVQAHHDLGSPQTIPMHFGTFRLSAEAFDQPLKDLKSAIQKMNIPDNNFILMREGETHRFRGDNL